MISLQSFKTLILLLVLLRSCQQSNSEQAICGPALDTALNTLCENGFNTKFKKSMQWDDLGNNEMGGELPSRYWSKPYLAKIHGGQVDTLANTRRRREGVYDECCRKGCTYSEIYSYCK